MVKFSTLKYIEGESMSPAAKLDKDLDLDPTETPVSQNESSHGEWSEDHELMSSAADGDSIENTTPLEEKELEQDNLEPSKQKKSRSNGWIKWVLVAIVIVVLIAAGLIAGVFYAVDQLRTAESLARAVEAPAREMYDAIKAQDLVGAKGKLQEVEQNATQLHDWYKNYGWMSSLPFVNAYYADGEAAFAAGFEGIAAARIGIGAVEPYADVLGFSGEGTFTGGGIDERIKIALQTLSAITPELDSLEESLRRMDDHIQTIDPNRYPTAVQGIAVRDRVLQVQSLSSGALTAIDELRPVIEVLPQIAGGDGERKKYLIIFQNDNELRATGGFMTAYATLFVEDGRVMPEKSDDIYELDKKFRNKPPIPEILGTYLKTETRWNLRDMNLSPDFKNSMDVFWSYYQQIPGEPKDVDGIIAVDTHVLENIVRIIGPVSLPGYGTFTAEIDPRCDCPQIIYALSEIIDRPTPYIREDRKGIIGPLMQAILSKAYASPRQVWPTLAQTGWENILGKHVQFYFFDETQQAAAEVVNAAGRVMPVPEGSDYLFIVDTNLGGAKSNLFVQSDVKHAVTPPENGRISKQLEIEYRNPFKPSNCNLEAGELCLNGKLTNWLRVYLPPGAEIEQTLGFEEGTTNTSEEFDRVKFEGVFTLQPLNQVRVRLNYTVPYDNAQEYRVYVQKQGGTRDISHTFDVNGGEYQEVANQDLLLSYPW